MKTVRATSPLQSSLSLVVVFIVDNNDDDDDDGGGVLACRPVKSVRISGPLIYPAGVKTRATRQLRYSFPSSSSSFPPRSCRTGPVCLWHKITRSTGKSNKFVSYNLSLSLSSYHPCSPLTRHSNSRFSLFRSLDCTLRFLSPLVIYTLSWTEFRSLLFCMKTCANRSNATLGVKEFTEAPHASSFLSFPEMTKLSDLIFFLI